jgi:hypothetical protein
VPQQMVVGALDVHRRLLHVCVYPETGSDSHKRDSPP